MKFMKFRYLYLVFSLCFLLPGMISLAMYGLKPSIDFTGGSLLQIKVQQKSPPIELSQENLQKIVADTYQIATVQKTGQDDVLLRGKPISNDQKNTVLQKLQASFVSVKEEQFQTIGPILGKELLQKTIFAGILVTLIIIAYVWHQFHDLKYGVTAVVAMFHDAFIVLGAFSILGKLYNVEVDTLFVTALLTILSFSVHDTIIVFDRIRETVKQHPATSFMDVINAAVIQTLGRSINNSMTVVIMLLTLVLLGGQTVHWFAMALLIGAITGTYSSTFTAAPLLLVWDEVSAKIKLAKLTKKLKN